MPSKGLKGHITGQKWLPRVTNTLNARPILERKHVN